MCDIYIDVNPKAYYPDGRYFFNPDTNYPEYPWGNDNISPVKNYSYEMVRNCFIGLGLDKENYNTKQWNPLKSQISENQTVLIKPNWVMHQNKNKKVKKNAMECLVTHPSIIRALCDYCYIALGGTGKIIVGDAPMQGCDLEKMLEEMNYNLILDFYIDKKTDISFIDFREYRTVFNNNKIIVDKRYTDQENVNVDLNIGSKHYNKNSNKLYQVSDYDERDTKRYHYGNVHKYSINKMVLCADIILNVCKPKTHRLAGITACQKNIVGITYNKACLPHRTKGSKQEGGDEYFYKSKLKKFISYILSKKIIFENSGHLKLALLMRYSYGVLYYIMLLFSKDKFIIGSWHGNDTIWRTVNDLNMILRYADKHGKMCNGQQRKIFNIADMIIAGEGNGPVAPSPKTLGLVIAGENSVIMDRVICEIMGFNFKKIPGLEYSLHEKKFVSKILDEYVISSNFPKLCQPISKLKFPKQWKFKSHVAWRDII